MTTGSTETPEGVRAAGELNGDTPGWSPLGVNDSTVINNSNEAFDVLFGGESEEWPEQASTKGFRASWTITVLVALLLLVSGLSLGAYLQRGQPSTSSTAAAGGRFGAGFAGAGGAGAGGASATSSTVTSGTVTDIIGNTLYVTNASGALVAVKISSATTIDRNASSTLSSLKPGDTVTVQGPIAKNGSVQAASVSATAKGVTSVGGFGGGGFGGGGGGAPSASTSSGSGASAGG